jgi:3'(2'), 5'-bisphosphate nucleotidase
MVTRFTPSCAGIEWVVDVALEAARSAMAFYGREGGVALKGDGSPVTRADRAAHEVICGALRNRWPDIPIISEEGSVPPHEGRRDWRRFWLVDPLDGTKEFLAANGEFTVNIALVTDGTPELGVIAAPALDAVYFAERGGGAWRRVCDGPTVRIRATPPPPDRTRVVESRSHPAPELEAFIAELGPVERVPLGSSLKFCRIAEGRADLYPRFGATMEWDVAAGDCIFRNATEDGRERFSPLRYNQPTLCTPRFVVGERSAACARIARQV